MTKFHRLFSVRVTHAYFDSLISPDLGLAPTQHTAKIMNQCGLRLRDREGVWEGYVPSDSPIWTMLKSPNPAEERNSLDFELTCTDPNFTVFTDLPFDLPGRLLYSSDHASNHTNGLVLLEPMVADTNLQPKLGLLTIGLTSLQMEIERSGEVTFEISFVSRSTYWRYYLLNRGTSAKSYSLTAAGANGGSMVFNGPDEEIMANGEIAQVYASESPMPLKETAGYTPNLSIRSNGTVSTLRLPVPARNQIRFEEINGKKQAVSNMYVYL